MDFNLYFSRVGRSFPAENSPFTPQKVNWGKGAASAPQIRANPEKPLTISPQIRMMEMPREIPVSRDKERKERNTNMNIDIKAKIEELAEKLQQDPALLKRFQADPIKTVEGLLGVDLPDDKLQPLVTGIKAKLAASDIGAKLDGLKKLF